jgi:hypothetical protein
VIEIATVFARCFDVLSEIDATYRKRPTDATQNRHWIGLVVNGIKRSSRMTQSG